MIKRFSIALGALLLSPFAFSQSMTLDSDGLRHLAIGKTAQGSIRYAAELDGKLVAYTSEGKRLWQVETDAPAVVFDIEAADINGDQQDDLLAVSAQGAVYAWDHQGKLLWRFAPEEKVRLSEIAVVKNQHETKVFTGGNNFVLYELSAKGQLLSQTKIPGVVRSLAAGHFTSSDKQDLFVLTLKHDKYGWGLLGIIDSDTKQVIHSVKDKDPKLKTFSRLMVTDLDISDLDQDGRDDILLFATGKASKGSAAALQVFDHKMKMKFQYGVKNKVNQRYAHMQGVSLMPDHKQIVLQFGGLLHVVDTKAKAVGESGSGYAAKGEIIYNDLAFDSLNQELIGAGQIGGGNTLYAYSLAEKKWWQQQHKLAGRIAEVEANLQTLYEQVLNFKRPNYQAPATRPWVMLTSAEMNQEVANIQGAELIIAPQVPWTEKTDRAELIKAIGKKHALKVDKRKKYNMTEAQLVAAAKKMEKQGKPFAIWTGHGTDPFIVTISAMEKILEAAPTTCYGFIYAEMQKPSDPRNIHFAKEYIPRLAKALRKHGKAKLFFRYKNVFWAAAAHEQPWKEVFLSGKYSDVLVPSAEDTASRTQDLNFVGRVGMYLGHYVDDFAVRLVDDNPTSWRPLSPGGQISYSPYLRSAVLHASYGSRSGIVFSNKYSRGQASNILFAMMKSELLPQVERENLLSINSWHLIDDVDHKYVHSIENHHALASYTEQDKDGIFSVAQMHWAGTSLPDYDYSKLALGLDYRWLNYLPPMPNGMVPVAPYDSHKMLQKQKTPYSISDTKVGKIATQQGALTKVPAAQYQAEFEKILQAGKATMPILVEGASWSAIRLDKNHVRLILIDPGYINPKATEVTIRFNGHTPISATDILTKQGLKLGSSIKLTVPAGSMRFIDLAYSDLRL